ncbi:MAG TPA: hypothetical protein VHN36_11755 [Ilumatobacteraceae bacterium]|nr:hypothetical protein [Ilumatobacteraceae bacterium]
MANEQPTTPAWALAAPTAVPSSTEILAATIGSAVERQLTQSVTAMTQQVEAAREEMRAEFTKQLQVLTERVDTNQETTDRYQSALQAALEERLAEFANHQHQTLTTINNKMAGLPSLVQFAAVSEGLRDYLERKTAAVETQIDDLHKSSRRFDEQAAAIVASINETVAALSKRMDDGDHVVSKMIDQRIGDVRVLVDQSGADLARQLAEHSQILSQRVDTIDMKMVDRALAMEERINEHNGVKLANLEASLGRLGGGFDDAMGALSKRLVDLEASLLESGERMDGMAADIAKVDEEAINAVKEQLSSAVGEAMLVRIEVDRFIAAQDEKFDATALRMTEIEAQLTDTMDVSEAIQLERLEEIERALLELDPNQFVRKVESTSGGGFPSPSTNPTLPSSSNDNSSEHSYSSY